MYVVTIEKLIFLTKFALLLVLLGTISLGITYQEIKAGICCLEEFKLLFLSLQLFELALYLFQVHMLALCVLFQPAILLCLVQNDYWAVLAILSLVS